MAATVVIYRRTDATGATKTDLSTSSINTRADLSDVHSTASTSNPIPIPGAGTSYSYWVNTQLEVTSGGSTTINNVEWFTDALGAFPTGVGMIASTTTDGGYDQGEGTSTSGTELTNGNYSGTLTPTTPGDASSYVTGAPLSVAGTLTTTGTKSDIVVYQISVTSSTVQLGATGQVTLSWRYDEA